jgi:ATP:ADP antiporter, AAA family
MGDAFTRLTNVRRDEVPSVLAAVAFFFCILTALMVVRPARDALGMQRGIEEVRWLFYGTAIVTLLANPPFGWLVSRFRRMAFVATTYLFFSASLVGFYLLLVGAPQAVGERSGQVFYVWFSVFNLFVTMVFWAMMADRFSLEQGKRFFGVVAVGGTLGALFGPLLAGRLAEPLGTPALLLVAVAFLTLAIGCAGVVAWLQPARPRPDSDEPAVDARSIIGGSAWEGFRAVFRSRYLLGIAGFLLIMAVMVTFLYFTRLQMVAALGDDVDMRTRVFANIDAITQGATLFTQLFITGHLMKRVGVPFALALLPVTVALGFVGLAITGTLAALIVFEAVFRSVQRGIMRPARETLWTVVSREDKYKSKAFIDTFVIRGGDVVGAQTEGALGKLGFGLAGLAAFVVPLAAVWAALAVWLGREQRREALREEARTSPPPPPPPAPEPVAP